MFQLLDAIRNRLASDAALNAWVTANCRRSASYFVGIKPDYETGTAVPSDLLPYVAVSHVNSDKPAGAIPHNVTVSVLIGIYDDGMIVDNGKYTFTGMKLIFEMQALVLAALDVQPLLASPKCIWDGGATTQSDGGMMHPFYEMEMSITVQVRP